MDGFKKEGVIYNLRRTIYEVQGVRYDLQIGKCKFTGLINKIHN